jgi:hypothetical protein
MPHQKLIRVLNYVWLLVVFPVAVAILVGVLGHSTSLGFKTFLLIECGMAVLSPLLSAVISGFRPTFGMKRKFTWCQPMNSAKNHDPSFGVERTLAW